MHVHRPRVAGGPGKVEPTQRRAVILLIKAGAFSLTLRLHRNKLPADQGVTSGRQDENARRLQPVNASSQRR